MKTIFSKTFQRHIQIINYLIESHNWVTIPALSTLLNCSYQSLSTDIKYINGLIAPFEIETSKRYGIRLLFSESKTLDYLFQQLIKNNPECNLLEFLFYEESLDRDSLSEAIYLSPSTLVRVTNRIKKNLKPLNIFIETAPYHLSGDEVAVRHFIKNLLVERYPYQCYPFSVEYLEQIDHIINLVTKSLNFEVDYLAREKIRIYIYVSFTRIQNKHFIADKTIITTKFSNILNKIMNESSLIKSLNSLFNIFIKEDLLYDILYPFSKYQSVESIHTFPTNPRFSVINLFIDDLKSLFYVDDCDTSTLALDIFNFEVQFTEHDYLLTNQKGFFINNIIKKYPHYTTQLSNYIKNSKSFGDEVKSSDYQIELMVLLLTHWPNLFDLLTKNMRKVRVGVIGKFDNFHSLFIADMIKYHFSEHVDVSANIDFNLITEFDLIITANAQFTTLDTNIYLINPSPSAEDFTRLQKIIFDLTAKVNFS